MEWLGLIMFAAIGAGAIFTGLPIWVVLIGVSVVGIGGAVGSGIADISIFATLPGRLIGLLESDLLQALPLFAAMGALLNRLPLADTLYRAGFRLLGGGPRAGVASGLLLGAFISPMNGSVSANAISLTRVLDPALARSGIATPDRLALIALASTLGVLVPPSLVLILLGDGMMAAHTIAVNNTSKIARIVNTQDVFRGALLPALMVLMAALAIVVWRAPCFTTGTTAASRRDTLATSDWVQAGVTLFFVGALLCGVAMGYFYAVEAAAMGAVGLFLAGILSGQLTRERFGEVLDDTLSMTGALFALLIAATTFTLVFRVFQSDKLVAAWIMAVPGGDIGLVIVALAIIMTAAFVLDAFEIIFVLIPILMPPVLMRIDDAAWMAVLTLLVLQTSFLLPPLGYALVMTRTEAREPGRLVDVIRSLAPFLVAQIAILGLVAAFPALANGGTRRIAAPAAPVISNQELGARMRDMLKGPAAAEELPSPKF